MTLLENLIQVDDCQGGTIHQYINFIEIKYGNFNQFEKNWSVFSDKGEYCLCFSMLNSIAGAAGIKINWSESTLDFYNI